MPTPRVLMSKIRQALQLLAGDSGLSMRQVASALGVSKTTVSEIAMYARDAGVDWPLASTLSDDELLASGYVQPRVDLDEVADRDWMQMAWLLRYECRDLFIEMLLVLRAIER